jgi:predicted lipoprotein
MKDTMTLTLRKLFGPTLAVLVISVIALSTTYVTGADVTLLEKGVKAKVDSAAFAEAYYEEQIVPYILENAQDLAEMDAAIIVDSNSAGAIYGNQDGPNAAYSVPTMFTAIAGELKGDLLVLEIEGVETKVYLQVGPALNGTAIRDVSYQDVGTKLNDKVRDLVLSLVDKKTLTGKTLNIVGAFSLFNPAQYMIVPVALEVVE